MSDKNSKIEDLQWVRIFDPVHIPRYLVEQVRDRDWSVDKFYQYQREINIQKDGDNIVLNPLNLLFVLIDIEKKVKGFMWAAVEALSNALVINTFSMDKEYWGLGEAVKLLETKAREIAHGAKLSKVYWITNFPKHSERYGFKRSRSVLMEYSMEAEDGQNIQGRRRQTGGEGKSDDSRPNELSEEHSSGTWAASA